MTATLSHRTAGSRPCLYVAIEMGWSKIKVASSDGPLQKPRLKELKARDLAGLEAEFAKARERFGLAADAAVYICYEAGRDGFWLQRWLVSRGYHSIVVDPGSLKVNRRRKQAKTDRLDAVLLLENLMEHVGGKRKVWSVVAVPTLEQEDRRQLHRELETLKGERTEHVNRIKSILATLGLQLKEVHADFASWLSEQRLLETGGAVPADHQARLLREHIRWQMVNEQIEALEKEQRCRVAQASTSEEGTQRIRKLLTLKGLGVKSSSLFVWEIFNWRRFANRRQLGSLAGLAPTPYQSGAMDRELGISKAGNSWLRGMMVEIAWVWLHWQPTSVLSQWYQKRFGGGTQRQRKIGIVALARKLLIALWRWLEFDVWPEEAVASSWQQKVGLKTT
jgi:transposase